MFLQALLFAHLSGVIVWVGGMFFAYFCLRPAAVKTLEPPQRLPLWVASFETFLRYAAIAVVVILASGLALMLQIGFKFAPIGWHIMMLLGFLMAAIFAYVYGVLYGRLRSQVGASTWPAAAATLNKIRQMVGLNLLLSVLTVAAVSFAR